MRVAFQRDPLVSCVTSGRLVCCVGLGAVMFLEILVISGRVSGYFVKEMRESVSLQVQHIQETT